MLVRPAGGHNELMKRPRIRLRSACSQSGKPAHDIRTRSGISLEAKVMGLRVLSFYQRERRDGFLGCRGVVVY